MLKNSMCMLFCTMVLSGFSGCMQVVHVSDPEGNPIEGVHVTTAYQEGYIGPSGPSGTTNSRGNAYLSIASPPYPLWMNYDKQGYFRSADGYSTNLRINKTLTPIAGAN